MKKLMLDLDSLRVDSFHAGGAADALQGAGGSEYSFCVPGNTTDCP